jgi:hypothetical protein
MQLGVLGGRRTNVTNAFLFFSTAYTKAFLLARVMALSARATSGPRPAPATHIRLQEYDQPLCSMFERYMIHTCDLNWANPSERGK